MEFVSLALNSKIPFSALCKSFNISRQNGYKWLNRFKRFGKDGLKEKSRRPKSCPKSTRIAMVNFIVEKRLLHHCWDARKIRRLLQNKKHKEIPSAPVIHKIISQNGLINQKLSQQTKSYRRFQYLQPNEMLQMDFKGDFPITFSQRCYPLTIIDDCSRFLLCVELSRPLT
jgi:transposase